MLRIKPKDYEAMTEAAEKLFELDQELVDLLRASSIQFHEWLSSVKNADGVSLVELMEKRGELKESLVEGLEDTVSQMDAYMGERSERWLDSDKGQAYQEWRDQWETLHEEVASAELDCTGDIAIRGNAIELEIHCEDVSEFGFPSHDLEGF